MLCDERWQTGVVGCQVQQLQYDLHYMCTSSTQAIQTTMQLLQSNHADSSCMPCCRTLQVRRPTVSVLPS